MMSNWKRFVLILTAAVMTLPLYCCGEKEETSGSSVSDSDENTSSQESNSDEESSQSAAEITAATEQAPIPQEYDGSEVDDACAKAISDYFTAIMNQDYEAYKATLDPYYFQVYSDWLDGNFGYGMEISFETMHQNLMDQAGAQNVTIQKVTLHPAEPADGETDIQEAIDDYLADYDSIIGAGFSEELKKQCDELVDIQFTLTADCDGTEKEIMTDMELLMTVKDGVYRILG